ncbi:MAG: hypothetical protein O7D30_07505 [Rickettsia endosymbiont of Ixodes persulcatus]|nr:hypothetical protein [Rickettsia endosymbiont of Ixodes persulcatus]
MAGKGWSGEIEVERGGRERGKLKPKGRGRGQLRRVRGDIGRGREREGMRKLVCNET